MKKTILGLAGVFIYIIAFMSCGMPQSITIKGKPKIHISMGSPFARLDDNERLENHVSSTKISEMMGNTGRNNVKVYDYQIPDDPETVQIYIVHYPLAELKLDYTHGFPDIPPELIPTDTFYLLENEFQISPVLTNFLGNNVTFKEVWGYIYVDDIGMNSTLSLSFSNKEYPYESLVNDSPLKSLSEKDRPEFPELAEDPFVKPVPPHSLINKPYIDLTKILNSNSDSTLNFQIKIPLAEINNNSNIKVIRADMIIWLPLKFKVDNPSSRSDYVKLEMNNVLPQPGNNDLFGRTGENDITDYFNYIKINLTDLENTIIDNNKLGILVASSAYSDLFDFSMPEPFLRIDFDDLPNPFNPRFEILLKKDTGENYATLEIKRPIPGKPPVFNFCITIDAQTDLEQTLTL